MIWMIDNQVKVAQVDLDEGRRVDFEKKRMMNISRQSLFLFGEKATLTHVKIFTVTISVRGKIKYSKCEYLLSRADQLNY